MPNTPEKDDTKNRRETNALSLPPAEPAPPRVPRDTTTELKQGWRLRWRFEQKQVVMPVRDNLIVGRVLDEEDQKAVGFDLTPYGAFSAGVSRQHARITLIDGLLYLEDMGSTNGTRINGFQVTPHQLYRLRDNDEIEFGRLRVILRFERDSA